MFFQAIKYQKICKVSQNLIVNWILFSKQENKFKIQIFLHWFCLFFSRAMGENFPCGGFAVHDISTRPHTRSVHFSNQLKANGSSFLMGLICVDFLYLHSVSTRGKSFEFLFASISIWNETVFTIYIAFSTLTRKAFLSFNLMQKNVAFHCVNVFLIPSYVIQHEFLPWPRSRRRNPEPCWMNLIPMRLIWWLMKCEWEIRICDKVFHWNCFIELLLSEKFSMFDQENRKISEHEEQKLKAFNGCVNKVWRNFPKQFSVVNEKKKLE